jgi:hypothetical protein
VHLIYSRSAKITTTKQGNVCSRSVLSRIRLLSLAPVGKNNTGERYMPGRTLVVHVALIYIAGQQNKESKKQGNTSETA